VIVFFGTEFKIDFLYEYSFSINIQAGLSILVKKNLSLQTTYLRKRRGNRSFFEIFRRYCLRYVKRKDRYKSFAVYPCVTCHYRIRKRRRLYFDVETLAKHWKGVGKKINISAVLVLATNRRCGACAAYIFLLTKANKNFSPFLLLIVCLYVHILIPIIVC